MTVIVTLFAALRLPLLTVSLKTKSVALLTVGAVKLTVEVDAPLSVRAVPEVCVHAQVTELEEISLEPVATPLRDTVLPLYTVLGE